MLAVHSKNLAESPGLTEYMCTRWMQNEQKVNVCAKKGFPAMEVGIKTGKINKKSGKIKDSQKLPIGL